MQVYDVFNVRLVFAPPSSVGNLGDTDNWMYCVIQATVFRVCFGKVMNWSEYAAGNKPYKPRYVPEVSVRVSG